MNTLETLPAYDHTRLVALEARIAAGKETFVDVGLALLEIRDGRLYRETHSSFQNYCRTKWGFSGTQAHRLIEAAAVVDELRSPIGERDPAPVPANEAQARPLTSLPKADRPAAWQEATEQAKAEGKPVTAKHVREAVKKRKPAPAKPSVEPPSDFEPFVDPTPAPAEPAHIVQHEPEAVEDSSLLLEMKDEFGIHIGNLWSQANADDRVRFVAWVEGQP